MTIIAVMIENRPAPVVSRARSRSEGTALGVFVESLVESVAKSVVESAVESRTRSPETSLETSPETSRGASPEGLVTPAMLLLACFSGWRCGAVAVQAVQAVQAVRVDEAAVVDSGGRGAGVPGCLRTTV